jgi:hypothetical protein
MPADIEHNLVSYYTPIAAQAQSLQGGISGTNPEIGEVRKYFRGFTRFNF